MRRKGIAAVIVALSLCAGVETFSQSGDGVFTIDRLPKTAEEFTELRNQIAATPEGGAAAFLVALITYVNDNDLGLQFLTLSLDQSNLQAGDVYRGYRPARALDYHLERLRRPERKHVPYAYLLGTRREEGYAASLPYRIRLTRNRYSVIAEDRIKVFVQCAGASMPRPVTLRRNDKGVWKVFEASSLFLDVMAPPSNRKDDL